jgi:hypothetical protein
LIARSVISVVWSVASFGSAVLFSLVARLQAAPLWKSWKSSQESLTKGSMPVMARLPPKWLTARWRAEVSLIAWPTARMRQVMSFALVVQPVPVPGRRSKPGEKTTNSPLSRATTLRALTSRSALVG